MVGKAWLKSIDFRARSGWTGAHGACEVHKAEAVLAQAAGRDARSRKEAMLAAIACKNPLVEWSNVEHVAYVARTLKQRIQELEDALQTAARDAEVFYEGS